MTSKSSYRALKEQTPQQKNKIIFQKIKTDCFGICKGIGGPLRKEEKVDIKWEKFER